MCDVPVSRIRYYDRHGVIKPCHVDDSSGYRYYDDDTLMQVTLLKYYQNTGFKLKEIEKLLQRFDLDHLEKFFDEQLDILEKEITMLRIRTDSIKAWKGLIHEQRSVSENKDQDVHICRFADAVMYVNRLPGFGLDLSYRTLLSNFFHGSEKDVCTTGALTLYYPSGDHDDRTGMKLYIRPHELERSSMERETVSAGLTLSCYHAGSFDDLESTYSKILDFAEDHDLKLRGDSFERSVIDIWSTTNEDEFLIEVIMPVDETSSADVLSVLCASDSSYNIKLKNF